MIATDLHRPRPRRIFLECTATYISGLTTGIQRVVRSIVNQAREVGEEIGLECHAVCFDEQRHQFVAINHLPEPVEHRVVPKIGGPLVGEIARLCAGDLLILADASWTAGFWPCVERLKRRGVIIGAVYYDMLPLEHPDWFDKFLVDAYAKHWGNVRRTASFLACISEATLQVAHHFDRASVMARPAFQPLRGFSFPLGAELDGAAKTPRVRRRLSQFLTGSCAKTFLAVGTVSPRKGYTTVLNAFEQHWNSGGESRLIIVGGYGWNSPEFRERIDVHARHAARLAWFNDLTDGELEHCYRSVDALITASLGEGFNLPIVEALRRGKPVVASDLPVHREVAGEYAAYFPAGSAVDLTLLLNDPSRWMPPVIASPVDFRWPDWRECCRITLHRAASLADRIEDEERSRIAASTDAPTQVDRHFPTLAVQRRRTPIRVGIDMIAVQSATRNYGIGRYVRNLTQSLFKRSDLFEFVLYQYEIYEPLPAVSAPHCTVQTLSGADSTAAEISRIASQNPDGLDWLLLTSPFESLNGYEAPARAVSGVPIAAIVYDLIPLIYPDWYLVNREIRRHYQRVCRKLASYDRLLSISEATRGDLAHHLGIPLDRTINISGAVESSAFRTRFPTTADVDETSAVLDRNGVTCPFVFMMASVADRRKNIAGALRAYSLLPETIRNSHQLVLTCSPVPTVQALLEAQIAESGVQDRVVLTGMVSDEDLQVLLQRCSAFIFPSEYEGLGLPILEAMHCGAPVIAGRNSSQIEVAGDAAVLVNPRDEMAISDEIERMLTDSDHADRLRRAGKEQVRKFTWERSASLAADALAKSQTRRVEKKPRLALFAPISDEVAGIVEYVTHLAEQLASTYHIDLFYTPGRAPIGSLSEGRFGCWDARTFPRHHRAIGYERILYQMGDSIDFDFVYDQLIRVPGVITLHDYNLANFHRDYANRQSDDLWLNREFAYCEGRTVVPQTTDAFRIGDLPLNRRVIEAAEHLVVHSNWVRDRVMARSGSLPMSVIPRGVGVTEAPPDPLEVCRRHHLPANGLRIGFFEDIEPSNMPLEAIWAFSSIVSRFPDASLIFVGQERDNGEAQRYATAVAPRGRVRFLGHLGSKELEAVMSVTDVAMSLRRPPTRGETSGSLQSQLGMGTPSLVTNTGTFAEYPNDVVAKIEPGPEFAIRLAKKLAELCESEPARKTMRSAASCFIQAAAWPQVADQYRDLIEGAVAQRRCRARVLIHRAA